MAKKPKRKPADALAPAEGEGEGFPSRAGPGQPGEALVRFEGASLAQQNPYLVYLGGLDSSSHSTMISAAVLAVSVLSSGKLPSPEAFPWHTLDYAVVKRLKAILREMRDERGKDRFASRTIDKVLSLVRGVMRQSWLLGQISDDAFHKILEVKPLNDKRVKVGHYVEREEIAALLRTCYATGDVRGFRDAALISILVGAGLREAEAVAFSVEDYETKKGKVEVRKGKGRKPRTAYLLGVFAPVLDRWLSTYEGSGSDPFIPRIAPRGSVVMPPRHITTQAVNKVLTEWAKKASVRLFTPHDLRRTFITHQLERGVDPLRLARAVGHESPSTTMIYDRRTAESDRRAITGDEAASDRDEKGEAVLSETFALFE
jgi:integrase